MRDFSLNLSLVASSVIHLCFLLHASTLVSGKGYVTSDFVPIGLIEVQPAATKAPADIEQKKPEKEIIPKEKTKQADPTVRREAMPSDRAAPAPDPVVAQQPPTPRPAETNASLPVETQEPGESPSDAAPEAGASEAGAGNPFAAKAIPALSGNPSSAGGLGTGAGLSKGAGIPAPSRPSPVLKTSREANPVQTVRATYPAMALRMGIEADVTLIIEVNAEGKVTKAEVVKNAGMGFDEEALKAIKESRFEPAQKDGENVPAEFTYIYRFRLAK